MPGIVGFFGEPCAASRMQPVNFSRCHCTVIVIRGAGDVLFKRILIGLRRQYAPDRVIAHGSLPLETVSAEGVRKDDEPTNLCLPFLRS